MFITPALGKWRQEDQEFKASIVWSTKKQTEVKGVGREKGEKRGERKTLWTRFGGTRWKPQVGGRLKQEDDLNLWAQDQSE